MRIFREFWFCFAMTALLFSAPAFSAPQAASATQTASSAKEKKTHKTAPASPVDLNKASEAELESVPGIGASTAKKIVAGRPYSSVADLSKTGLSSKQIQSFSSMVKVSSAPSAPVQSAPPSPVATPSPASRRAPRSSTPAVASPSPSAAPAPGGGAGMVWVNTETKVFHRQRDKWYGKTKKGKYMTEADAIRAGYHESKEKSKS